MQIALAVIAVGVILLLGVLAALLAGRFRPSVPSTAVSPEIEEQMQCLRDQKADLERRLAVEEVKSAKVTEIERELTECQGALGRLSADKSTAEKECAVAIGAGAHLQSSLEDVKARLGLAEQRLERLRSENTELQNKVAEGAASLAGNEEERKKLVQQVGELSASARTAEQEISELRVSLGTTREALEQERRQSAEKLALLAEARERMAQEFKSLASDVMKSHGETFSSQNREQIEAVLAPLREKLGDFQLGLQAAQTESSKERAILADQIRQLSEKSAALSSEASSLTRALKGEAQTQGAWGEMILASILERSGLREGEEYVVQESHTNDEGARRRPDVIVKLPGGQKIVIDSKLSLVAFQDYVNAASDAERQAHMKRHLVSLRSHIKELSTKEYHSAVGSELDYAVMFIPIEGALAAALQEEPRLTAEAVDANVAIATPTTLMIALRTVSNVWQVERRNQNAEMIAQKAGKLYDKFVGFLGDMASVGGHIDEARTSYDQAVSKLSTGRGNLVGQVENLKRLGARTGKSIPAEFLEEGEVEPAEGARTLAAAGAIRP